MKHASCSIADAEVKLGVTSLGARVLLHLPDGHRHCIQEPKGSPSPLDLGGGAALPNPTCVPDPA